MSSLRASEHEPGEPMLGRGEFRRMRHSIGDFLQIVYTTAAMLRSRLPQSAVQEQDLINHLRFRAEVCKSLVDNVQDYLCTSNLSPESVNLSQLCIELIGEFKPRFPAVDWKFTGEPAVLVRGDRQALFACGRQLMMNAVQAGASHVTLQVRSGGDATIRWEVLDDGSGIQEADPVKLFEPFVGDRSGQAGLGLTLVERNVMAMNGQVTLCNRRCGGAQVSVSLPVGSAASAPEPSVPLPIRQ